MATGISNSIDATTLNIVVKDIKDTLFEPTTCLDAMEKTKSIKEATGGGAIQVGVGIGNHSTLKRITSADTALSSAHADTLVKEVASWAHCGTDIVVSFIEELESRGNQSLIDLWKIRAQREMAHMRDVLERRLVAASELDDAFDDLTTFNGCNDSNGIGESTGVFESPAALQNYNLGGQNNIVNGIDKARYQTFSHQWATAAGDFSANGRPSLDGLLADCKKYDEMGMDVDLLLGSFQGWQNLRAKLATIEQTLVKGDKTQGFGYGDFLFNTVPVAYSRALDEHNAAATAGDIITFYALNFRELQLWRQKDSWFSLQDPTSYTPSQFLGKGAAMTTSVQLMVPKLNGCGLLVNGNTF